MRPTAAANDLPIYMSEVPEYEPRGDCIRVTWRSMEMFIPVPIMQAALGRAHRAMDQWYESKGTVVPFRPVDVAAE